MKKTECKTGVGLFHRVRHSLKSLLFYSIVAGNTTKRLNTTSAAKTAQKPYTISVWQEKNIR